MRAEGAVVASSKSMGTLARRSPETAQTQVELRAVAHSFGTLAVLRELSVEIRERELVAIVGPSGCGKSTLLELVAGLREPAMGAISVGGDEGCAERLARCAYMPQRDLLFPWLSAVDNAALALRNRGASRAEARAAAAPLFARFGLEGFEAAAPGELSGGMRQRVAFLRTLLARKPVLLLDEPFGSLDTITRAEMQEWLATALRAEPRTVLLVTHDVEEALYLADRVLVLSSRPGRVVAELAYPLPRGPRTETVTAPAFADLRERALVALAEGRA
jgi:ABC-type nitrate/sulfonate/bicarbonate transport system ATPase subunit